MKKKYFVIGLVVLAVAIAVWFLVRNKEADTPAADPFKTATVSRGNIELIIDAVGSVESNLDVEIKSKASGQVVTLPYDVSDHVPKYAPGQNEAKALLMELDPVDEQNRVKQAQAAVEADKARLEQARSNLAIAVDNLRTTKLEVQATVNSAKAKADMAHLTLKREQELFDRKVSTQDELDNASTLARVADADLQTALSKQEALKGIELAVDLRKADVDLAQANLDNSNVALADANQRLIDTKIYSPIDGVITARTIQIGQIAASGVSNVGGGTSLLTVSDLSHIFVMASVDESDIGHLHETGKLGQEVTVTTDSYPGKRFTGKVVQITPRGTELSNVVTYPVKIEVFGEGKNLLLPKMTANVRIMANRHENVLLLPNAAIRYDKDEPYVDLVLDDDPASAPASDAASQPQPRTQKRAVKLGLNDGVQAEVLEGLQEGDEVQVGVSNTRWSNEGKTSGPTVRMSRSGKPRVR